VTRALSLLGRQSPGSFSDTVPHVRSKQCNIAVASAQEAHADSVITVGGGATTGYGKIIALSLRIPLIAVPTTYSGAEMTSRYFVTTDRGKESGASERVLPRVVVHDPELTAGLPPAVVGSSGVTAVVSCLGALMRAETPPEVAAWASEGLELLWHTLPELLTVSSPSDLRRRAFEGAALAGRVLQATGPGLVQLVAEELGAGLGADHGAVLACLTAPALAAAGPEADPARRALRDLSGRNESADVVFRNFVQALGLSSRLSAICRVNQPGQWAKTAADRPWISARAGVDELTRLLEAA